MSFAHLDSSDGNKRVSASILGLEGCLPSEKLRALEHDSGGSQAFFNRPVVGGIV